MTVHKGKEHGKLPARDHTTGRFVSRVKDRVSDIIADTAVNYIENQIRTGRPRRTNRTGKNLRIPKKKRSESMSGEAQQVSKYHESRLEYKHKSGKKYVKKEKKFLKKIMKAMEFDVPVQTWIFTASDTLTNTSVPLTTTAVMFNVLSWKSTTSGSNDAGKLLANIYSTDTLLGDTNVPAGGVTGAAMKFDIIKMENEFIIANTGSGGSVGAFVDLYWCSCRKDIAVATDASFNLVYQQYETSHQVPNVSTLGVSLFESRDFCEHWLIEEKERIYLDLGSQVTKRRSWNQTRHLDGALIGDQSTTACKAGYTKGCMIIVTPFLGTNSLAVPQALGTVQVEVCQIKKFKVKPVNALPPALLNLL